ncbi:MAG: hypothetical protein ABIE47_00675, partial [Pseudomonadota bacterium]
ELLSASEKANHGSIPARKKIAKLSVPVSIGFSRIFKTTEKTKIYMRRLANGVRRLHTKPPIEPAKRPRISLLTKPQKSVRKRTGISNQRVIREKIFMAWN